VIVLLILVQHGSMLKYSCYLLGFFGGYTQNVRVKRQYITFSVACHTAIMTLPHVMDIRYKKIIFLPPSHFQLAYGRIREGKRLTVIDKHQYLYFTFNNIQ